MNAEKQTKATTLMKAPKHSKLIASIPHGASLITQGMKQQIREGAVLTNNDWALNEMYEFLTAIGVSTLCANYSCYMADANRCLESSITEGEYSQSVVYQFNTFGDSLYAEPLSRAVIEQRIADYWIPYHRDLEALVLESKSAHERVFLCDLHSFSIQSKSDIVLGVRGMTSCSQEFFELVRGGYITRRYSEIERIEALQIEIRYATYLEPREFVREEVYVYDKALFRQTQKRLKHVFN